MATQRGTGGVPAWVWWVIGIIVVLIVLALLAGPLFGIDLTGGATPAT